MGTFEKGSHEGKFGNFYSRITQEKRTLSQQTLSILTPDSFGKPIPVLR